MKPILLVQFRTDLTGPHEISCFRSEFDAVGASLETVNAVTEALPSDLSIYSGIILGGSGEFYLSEGHGAGTWQEATFALIERARQQSVPLLGICFGFQLLGMAYGATIVRNESMRETGTFLVTQYKEGASDELLSLAPETFLAQFAHKDSLINFPPSVIVLAKSERVAVEAFRVRGRDQWGFLFHPELNKKRMSERLSLLPSYAGGNSVDALLESFHDTPAATDLLHAFIKYAQNRNGSISLSQEEAVTV